MINYRLIQKQDNIQLAKLIRQVFIEFDVPKVGTVFSDPTTDDLYGLFNRLDAKLWVADEDTKILGCCGIYPTDGLPEHCAELVKYYLSPDARGKGVGKELMQLSLDSAVQLGYKSIYLESFPHFGTAVSIYKKMGFDKLDKPLGNSGHEACSLWMLKEL